jgi:hypothetical protein
MNVFMQTTHIKSQLSFKAYVAIGGSLLAGQMVLMISYWFRSTALIRHEF